MDKSGRISSASINNRLISFAINLASIALASLLLFFIALYGIFNIFGYSNKTNEINDIEEKYNLNLKEHLEYIEYEQVLKKFYLEEFSDEIVNKFKNLYNEEYTIIHIYNINVLGLMATPTYDNYKTNYYQYTQNQNGTFNVDELGTMVQGYGSVYDKNMSDLYYNSYVNLKKILEDIDNNYYAIKVEAYSYEAYSRAIALILSVLIFYIILPLLSKNKVTLAENKLKIALLNKKNGYIIKPYKVILRALIIYTIPIIGIILFSKYSIIILSVGYLFIELLILLLSKNNNFIEEAILRIESASSTESLIFKDLDDENTYFNTDEGKKITEESFLDKLSNVDTLNVKKD